MQGKQIIKSKALIQMLFYSRSQFKFNEYPIEQYQLGQRLDRFLKNQLGGWSSVQMLLRKKAILVRNSQGQCINEGSHFFKEGDVLLIDQKISNLFHNQEHQFINSMKYDEAKTILQQMIIFDNQNLTILNKKKGYTVQGGIDFDHNLYSLMSIKYKKQHVHITHRLDKPTTGILIFAKNLKTAQIIQGLIQQRIYFHKYYLANVSGSKIQQKGYIRANIEWNSQNKGILSLSSNDQSKDCVTFYKPISYNKNTTIIGLKLLTGRKHQIRCHLSQYLNSPILNDKRYGGQIKKDIQKDEIYLHAFQTIINSTEMVKLFCTKNQKQIIIQNHQGIIKIKGQTVTIIAGLSKIWQKKTNRQLFQIGQNLHLEESFSHSKLKRKDKLISII